MAENTTAKPKATKAAKSTPKAPDVALPARGEKPAIPLAKDANGTVQTLKDSASKLGKQATDAARGYAEDGKARAGGALDEIARMLADAAGTVDEKVGDQYGKYARSAADAVARLSDQLKNKEVDELIGDARDLVRKSPAVAIGTAAALGFVIARLVKAGLDDDKSADA